MIPSSIAGVASAPVNPNGPQGISGSGMPLQGLMSGSVPDEMMPLPNVPEEIVHDAPRQIPTQGTESMKVGVKSAKEVCPKALQDITVRRQLALLINEAYEAGETIRRANEKRYKRMVKFYRNRPEVAFLSGKPWKGAPQYNVPMITPRLRQRAAANVDTVTSPSPMFYVTKISDSSRANDVEADLDFILRISGFKKVYRQIIADCMPYNQVLLKVDFIDDPAGNPKSSLLGPYVGPTFSIATPEIASVFPANHPQIEENSFVGHKFEQRRADIIAKQKSGRWFDDINAAGIDQAIRTEDVYAKQQEGRTSKQEDDNIWLIDCLIRYDADGDGFEEVYRVIADPDQYDLYRIEPYESTECSYATYRFYEDDNAFWSEDSPVNDAQSLQLIFNEVFNQILYGFMYQTRPPTGATGLSKQMSGKQMKPGELLDITGLKDVKQLGGQMNLANVDKLISLLMALADAVTAVPDTVSAGPAYNKGELATTQNIKFSGFQLSGADDVKAMSSGLISTVRIVMWYMYKNFDRLKAVYGNSLKCQTGDVFWQGFEISLAGTTPNSTPDVQKQEITTTLQLFAQVPELQPLILQLVEKFVNQSSIEGKDDIVQEIKQIQEQKDQQAKMQQIMGLLSQLPPQVLQQFSAMAQGGSQPQGGQQVAQQQPGIPVAGNPQG